MTLKALYKKFAEVCVANNIPQDEHLLKPFLWFVDASFSEEFKKDESAYQESCEELTQMVKTIKMLDNPKGKEIKVNVGTKEAFISPTTGKELSIILKKELYQKFPITRVTTNLKRKIEVRDGFVYSMKIAHIEKIFVRNNELLDDEKFSIYESFIHNAKSAEKSYNNQVLGYSVNFLKELCGEIEVKSKNKQLRFIGGLIIASGYIKHFKSDDYQEVWNKKLKEEKADVVRSWDKAYNNIKRKVITSADKWLKDNNGVNEDIEVLKNWHPDTTIPIPRIRPIYLMQRDKTPQEVFAELQS